MRTCLILLTCCCAAFFCGCVQYNYVGQKFPATEDGKISFYAAKKDVPRDALMLIGRMTMICDDSLDQYDIRVKLLAKAREYGADAVSIVSEQKVQEGMTDTPAVALEFPNSNPNSQGADMYGDSYVVNSFGQQVMPEEKPYYDYLIKALFWKNRKTAEEYLAKHRGKLKDNVIQVVKKNPASEVKAPAAAKPAPLQK